MLILRICAEDRYGGRLRHGLAKGEFICSFGQNNYQ